MRLETNYALVLAISVAVSLAGCRPAGVHVARTGWSEAQRAEPDFEREARMRGHPTRRTPEELDEVISGALAGGSYEQTTRIPGRLEVYTVNHVELRAGRCYRFIMRLSPDAEWSPRAWSGVQIRLNELERLQATLRGPGLVTDPTCAVETRNPRLRVLPVLGEGDQSAWSDLGHGDYTIEVWSYAMTPEERGEAEAADAAAEGRYQRAVARREAQDQERERQRVMQRAAPGCLRCRLAWNDCAAASRTTTMCDAQYRHCLAREVPFEREMCPPPY